MNPPSGLLARRQLLLMLLLGTVPGTLLSQPRPDDWRRLPGAQRSSWLQRLRVPDPSDPWEIDAFFYGYRVKLALPQDLEKIALLAPNIQKTVRRRIVFRQRNIDVLRKVVLDLDRLLQSSPPVHLAQHEQTLEHVVMALPALTATGPWRASTLHEPVLAALPAYTQVDFFLPEELVLDMSRRLRALGMAQRVLLHGEKEFELVEDQIPLRHQTTYWMRDVFMTAADPRGRTLLLQPLAFYQINDLSRPDNEYVAKLANAQRIVARVPLFFKGGNLAIAAIGGRRILFIGHDELRLNEQFYYNAFFYFPPTDAVLELFRQITGADEVKVLPNSKHLYHLDMVMTVLRPGTVAVIEPLDDALEPEDRQVIAQVRQVLTAYGLHIVGIPTLADWVKKFKSPVNILPFRHRDTGLASAIVPQFEDQTVTVKDKPYSIHQKIRQAYADAGIATIFAVSGFHRLGGNFHCAVLPLK